MGSHVNEARARSGGSHRVCNTDGRECAVRGPCTYKHGAALRGIGSTALKIRCQRFADIRRQRKAFETPTFASDDELTCAPVDVVKIEHTYLASTQAQTREQHQDCEIATAATGAPIAGCE
jgi:hypothetical protein